MSRGLLVLISLWTLNIAFRSAWMIAPRQKKRRRGADSCFYSAVVWVSALCLVFIISLNSYAELLVLGTQDAQGVRFPPAASPSRLSICRNTVVSTTDFAIVSVVTSEGTGRSPFYQPAVKALGNSIQAHTNLDMVVITTLPLLVVQHNGWMVCYVDGQANITELLAWRLTQYKAVALLSLDTLMVGDPSNLFTTYFPHLLSSNKTLGAVSRSLCPSHTVLSTAVLLLIPSPLTYLRMQKKRRHLNYTEDDFPRLVWSVFQKRQEHEFLELPMEYNTNVKTKFCDPQWWSTAPIRILHFTLVKPWSLLSTDLWDVGKMHPWACWASGLLDVCELWKRYWTRSP